MHKLKLAVLHKLSYVFTLSLCDVEVEASKESKVTDRVGVNTMFLQLSEDAFEDFVHVIIVVIVVGFEPASVHVGVRYKVNLYLLELFSYVALDNATKQQHFK